jgi:hypothetical protein
MNNVALTWTVPPEVLAKGVGDYADRLLSAVYELAQVFAARIEAAAKANAPWQDRTGNARQGLFARAFREAAAVTLILAHSAHYGIWLEVRWAGKYAIILPTLEAHYGPYIAAIQGLLR